MTDVIGRRFTQFGFPADVVENVIPADDTTLFVCSGMQNYKGRFAAADGGTGGSFQSCVRTNDIGEVGDGSHLTHFVMVGNFSFGGPTYEHSVDLWVAVLDDLFGDRSLFTVHVHPDRPDHFRLWQDRRFRTVGDTECVWSDGEIGGYCCEVYVGGLEIGNLVNTLGHSTDVGFGLERLLQVMEGRDRVDETQLFDATLHPVARDHARTIRLLRANGVSPGNRGRDYVCRRLLRRLLLVADGLGMGFDDWTTAERENLAKRLTTAKRAWRKNADKPLRWWWDTHGIMAEEIPLLAS